MQIAKEMRVSFVIASYQSTFKHRKVKSIQTGRGENYYRASLLRSASQGQFNRNRSVTVEDSGSPSNATFGGENSVSNCSLHNKELMDSKMTNKLAPLPCNYLQRK